MRRKTEILVMKKMAILTKNIILILIVFFTFTVTLGCEGLLETIIEAAQQEDSNADAGDSEQVAYSEADTVTDTDTGTDADADADADTDTDVDTQGWLHTESNKILTADGRVWIGRGANLHDTRSCWACTDNPNVDEVKRRVDVLVDDWGATFIRLLLESYPGQQSIDKDPQYLADIVESVDHIGTKPGVYVLVSLWADENTFTPFATPEVPGSPGGLPTAATIPIWEKLAETFASYPYVMYGLVNEPEMNYSGAHSALVWQLMNEGVQKIRDVEDALGAPHHLVAVQGVGGWSRHLNYYLDNPITAAGSGQAPGENVIYEEHAYIFASEVESNFSAALRAARPVIIGEFGPDGSYSDWNAVADLIALFEAENIPWLAWTFHQRCSSGTNPDGVLDMLEDFTYGCGIGMELVPTAWGEYIKDQLAQSP